MLDGRSVGSKGLSYHLNKHSIVRTNLRYTLLIVKCVGYHLKCVMNLVSIINHSDPTDTH